LGQETVIAGVCFVAILLFSFYVYADSMNRISAISWKSVDVASNIRFDKLRSGVSISKAEVNHGNSPLYVDAINDGTARISCSDFAKMDIILTYTDKITGLTETRWCYYNSSDTSRCRWTLDPSFASNPHPSIVNPLDWDPSETLSLIIRIPASEQFKDKTDGYVKVVLPQGTSNGLSFQVA
jgi:hypothetical protein